MHSLELSKHKHRGEKKFKNRITTSKWPNIWVIRDSEGGGAEKLKNEFGK